MEYHDKVLKCSECGAEFVFTAGEQMFFADKGFKNEPKRCKSCKAKRAEGGGGGGHASPMRSETKTNCSQCGKETTVPFRPTQGRPVFCRECFQQRNTSPMGQTFLSVLTLAFDIREPHWPSNQKCESRYASSCTSASGMFLRP